jgi:hypothetical protein
MTEGPGTPDGPQSGYLLAMKSLFRYRPTKDYPARTRNQEQIRMITTAIGKPTANAPPIAKVNAESRFAAGRRLSTDMLLTPPIGKSKSRHPDEAVTAFWLAHTVQKPLGKGCLKMVNKVLIAGRGLTTNGAKPMTDPSTHDHPARSIAKAVAARPGRAAVPIASVTATQLGEHPRTNRWTPCGGLFGMQSYSIMQVPVCSKVGSAPMPRWQGTASLP